jgi:uroporphyrin-III C-methyltransferase/precorrin-2 dehydrogenase/sirohydrochlorin ferrochelatase
VLALASGHGAASGSIVLVGAGPGDPELLTLRAVRALQSADVILFDENIHSGILDFARREARKLLVRPSGSGDADASKQTEIEAMMIALAKAGRRVVRLTRGDQINATGVEAEIATCRAAGIAVEVVPGIVIAREGGLSHGDSLRRHSSPLPGGKRSDREAIRVRRFLRYR